MKLYYDERFTLGGKTVTVAFTNHFLDEALTTAPTRYHSHAGFEVQLIYSGSGTVLLEGNRYPIEKGDLVLIRPDQRHKIEPGSGEPLHRITFLFFLSGEADCSHSSHFIWNTFDQAPVFMKATNMADKLPEIETIRQELQEKGPCYLLRIRASLQGLFVSMARAFSSQCNTIQEPFPTDVDKNRAQMIEDFLNYNIYEKLTCKDLAKQLHLSQRQVERILQNLYKKNFRTLRMELLMETANTLLDEGNLTMEQIADQLGYGSVPAFYTAYRNYYGTTPGKRKTASKSDS